MTKPNHKIHKNDKTKKSTKFKISSLTQKRVKELLNYDPNLGIFTWTKKHATHIRKNNVAGHLHRTGTVNIFIDGFTIPAQRLVYLYVYGEFPINTVGFKNEIKTDLRLDNLFLTKNYARGYKRSKTFNPKKHLPRKMLEEKEAEFIEQEKIRQKEIDKNIEKTIREKIKQGKKVYCKSQKERKIKDKLVQIEKEKRHRQMLKMKQKKSKLREYKNKIDFFNSKLKRNDVDFRAILNCP